MVRQGLFLTIEDVWYESGNTSTRRHHLGHWSQGYKIPDGIFRIAVLMIRRRKPRDLHLEHTLLRVSKQRLYRLASR